MVAREAHHTELDAAPESTLVKACTGADIRRVKASLPPTPTSVRREITLRHAQQLHRNVGHRQPHRLATESMATSERALKRSLPSLRHDFSCTPALSKALGSSLGAQGRELAVLRAPRLAAHPPLHRGRRVV